jgi:hypothetical protein
MEKAEHLKIDPTFYDRADAQIHLSNSQLSNINPGKVSASMMYATARFNAYVSWIGFHNAGDMAEERGEIVRYFVEQYQLMLEENLEDYIRNFETYLNTPGRPSQWIQLMPFSILRAFISFASYKSFVSCGSQSQMGI